MEYFMTDKKLDILSVDFDWIENSRQQEELLTFLIPLIYDHKDITMAYMHEKIFSLISHGYDEYNIINIDHHHDFCYREMNVLNEGNWLFHACNVFKNKINYTWISNPTSEHKYYMQYKEFDNLKSYTFDHNINYIKQKKFDKIFMCCSPSTTTSPEAITAYKIAEKLVTLKI
jgi:hypothetical protein|tara:strand:+ start:1943 stop:2461 length:519 start_codon:yes stop_codon:yes gene_type:complete